MNELNCEVPKGGIRELTMEEVCEVSGAGPSMIIWAPIFYINSAIIAMLHRK